jgi:hypothetical protein
MSEAREALAAALARYDEWSPSTKARFLTQWQLEEIRDLAEAVRVLLRSQNDQEEEDLARGHETGASPLGTAAPIVNICGARFFVCCCGARTTFENGRYFDGLWFCRLCWAKAKRDVFDNPFSFYNVTMGLHR